MRYVEICDDKRTIVYCRWQLMSWSFCFFYKNYMFKNKLRFWKKEQIQKYDKKSKLGLPWCVIGWGILDFDSWWKEEMLHIELDFDSLYRLARIESSSVFLVHRHCCVFSIFEKRGIFWDASTCEYERGYASSYIEMKNMRNCQHHVLSCVGHVCPLNTISPVPCAAGTFQNGTFRSGQTVPSISCWPCPVGFYCPEATADPILCPLRRLCPENSSVPLEITPGQVLVGPLLLYTDAISGYYHKNRFGVLSG